MALPGAKTEHQGPKQNIRGQNRTLGAKQNTRAVLAPILMAVLAMYRAKLENCSDIRGFSHTTPNIRKSPFSGHPKMAEQAATKRAKHYRDTHSLI